MTAPRHRRKFSSLPLGAALWAALVGIPVAHDAVVAATTERIVADRNSGLAIAGFDPVAYFVDHAARPGTGEFEYLFAGAVWRFCNEGNRAAFIAHPEVYMPRFGGYDPVGAAREVAVPGHPMLWIVTGERLYLFHTAENRAAFYSDPDRIAATADRKWLSVMHQLAP